jgi:hypothetical protein
MEKLGFLPPVDLSTKGVKGEEISITQGKAEVFPQSTLQIHILDMNGEEPCIVLADQKTSNATSFCTGEHSSLLVGTET